MHEIYIFKLFVKLYMVNSNIGMDLVVRLNLSKYSTYSQATVSVCMLAGIGKNNIADDVAEVVDDDVVVAVVVAADKGKLAEQELGTDNNIPLAGVRSSVQQQALVLLKSVIQDSWSMFFGVAGVYH